ncbi:MAG: DUF3365 domain-containing protein [Elusimicrobiota bacterium]|jgi:hypothetical protein
MAAIGARRADGCRGGAGLERLFVLLAGVWALACAASLGWNIFNARRDADRVAHIQAEGSLQKDLFYRRWNAAHGGVYVEVNDAVRPNPFLEGMPEREVTTPSGKTLTLVNPATMSREVHAMQEETEGIRGHLTSLDPMNPRNVPDPWERLGLGAFASGAKEWSGVADMGGRPYFRLLRSFKVEQSCLKCHGFQGYRAGDVRGGISVSVPMAPLLAVFRHQAWAMVLSHAVICAMGLLLLWFAQRRLHAAEAEVESLGRLMPICASCKKIRDDRGYWSQVESYLSKNRRMSFTHGVCPECEEKLYPGLPEAAGEAGRDTVRTGSSRAPS